MNQEKIGKFIAECRKNKNITQEQLASKLNVTNKSVSRWENGKNMPDYSILKELCNILDIDVNEFLSGEKIEDRLIKQHTIDNLDLILKEYYKMKKQKKILKIIAIIFGAIIINLLSAVVFILFIGLGFNDKYDITTDINKYNDVIGNNAKGEYESKWGMSEEIFPSKIDNLNVLDFKMVYYNPWDKQFLSYLIVDYDLETYQKEISRLKKIGIDNYKGIYGVTGFTKYELIAMQSDSYQGFVYAITDGNKIIYVELIYCNYYMDIKYKEQIPNEYLPDNFDATIDNPYSIRMSKK